MPFRSDYFSLLRLLTALLRRYLPPSIEKKSTTNPVALIMICHKTYFRLLFFCSVIRYADRLSNCLTFPLFPFLTKQLYLRAHLTLKARARFLQIIIGNRKVLWCHFVCLLKCTCLVAKRETWTLCAPSLIL